MVRPEAMRSSVDLPQPEGPTTVTNSPGWTSKVVSSRAWVPSGNVIETPRNDNAAALPADVVAVDGTDSVMEGGS